jgi:hypothetical protein
VSPAFDWPVVTHCDAIRAELHCCVHPECCCTRYSAKLSHAIYVSQPEAVAKLIETAAEK